MNTLFDNTEIAFRSKSNKQLFRAYWLFRVMGFPELTKIGTYLIKTALKAPLGVKKIIKGTLYNQFCGGETLTECQGTMKNLMASGVYSIPDYVAEGQKTQKAFDEAMFQVLRTIELAQEEKAVAFAVFKLTALGRVALLEHKQAGGQWTKEEQREWEEVETRFFRIIDEALAAGVKVMVDAEETWIQDAIDELVWSAMFLHNGEEAKVFTTCQMYRRDMPDRLKTLAALAQEHSFVPGVKLVRGAYLEKENERASQLGQTSPLWSSKRETDEAFDHALLFAMEQKFALCIGTHNEASTQQAVEWIQQLETSPSSDRIWFAQLYGMSDHLTFNLAAQGFKTAKYIPFGPMELSLPYLFRRASENQSVAGQSGRELQLLGREIKRRKAAVRHS